MGKFAKSPKIPKAAAPPPAPAPLPQQPLQAAPVEAANVGVANSRGRYRAKRTRSVTSLSESRSLLGG